MTRSVGEIEYQAVAQGVTEVLWLKSLFSELGYLLAHTPFLWCDNLATKCIAENLMFHSRTKHSEIDVHFAREKAECGEVEIQYVPTQHQVADIFIEGLPKDRFLYLCDKLGLKLKPTNQNSAAKGHFKEV